MRIKALEGGGSEALKAAVDAKEAEVRQHLIGKLKEKVQKAKQDAIADAQKLILQKEQAAKDEAQSQIQALEAKLREIQSASEQAISSFEREKAEAAQVFSKIGRQNSVSSGRPTLSAKYP